LQLAPERIPTIEGIEDNTHFSPLVPEMARLAVAAIQ
jgi:hypothetical protein